MEWGHPDFATPAVLPYIPRLPCRVNVAVVGSTTVVVSGVDGQLAAQCSYAPGRTGTHWNVECLYESAMGKSRDYFAEMYVAGVLADAGWNVYFPRRDQGFAFIVTKAIGEAIFVRPVQVKGKYATAEKTDKPVYGYSGKLSQLHPEMLLAIPFFTHEQSSAPIFTAYMPFGKIRRNNQSPGEYRAFPARFMDGKPEMRRDFRRFFDAAGINLLDLPDWRDL